MIFRKASYFILYAYCFGQNSGARGEHLIIQLLWETVGLLVTLFIVLSTQWMKEMRLLGVSLLFFFFYLGFLSQRFTSHRTAGKREGISLTSPYHFHSLHRHLDISWAIAAESSPLHIGSCRTRTGSLWFPSASC